MERKNGEKKINGFLDPVSDNDWCNLVIPVKYSRFSGAQIWFITVLNG
jgi:hypothetical protein